MTTTAPAAGYRRALDAEPRLRAIERLVTGLCELARPGDTLCAGCVWELIVKPLTTPWIGWGRGRPHRDAADDPRDSWQPVSLADLLAEPGYARAEPATDTERWLRSSEAFDAFTDELLRRLDAADPANGHGIRAARGVGKP